MAMSLGGVFILLGLATLLWGKREEKDYYDSINHSFHHVARHYRMPTRIPAYLFSDILNEDDARVLMEWVEDVFQTGEPKFAYDGWVDTPGGRRWFDTTLTPVSDAEGGVAYVLGITKDITARKEAEAALRESEEHYRLLFENVNDIVCFLDAEMRLLSVSHSVESVLGYRPEDSVNDFVEIT